MQARREYTPTEDPRVARGSGRPACAGQPGAVEFTVPMGLAKDSDLDALRDRADFRTLMASIK
jgi:hypothetical protein